MDYKSVFTNLCLELQQNRSWIKGLGKNAQKSELIHWRQCLLSGGTEACSLGLRETPACIHVIQRLSQLRVACWHGFRQNSQKTECVFTRCPTGGRKKIACLNGLRSEGVKQCPITAKIAGSIGILPCCVLNAFFFTQGYERLPDLWSLSKPPHLVYGKFGLDFNQSEWRRLASSARLAYFGSVSCVPKTWISLFLFGFIQQKFFFCYISKAKSIRAFMNGYDSLMLGLYRRLTTSFGAWSQTCDHAQNWFLTCGKDHAINCYSLKKDLITLSCLFIWLEQRTVFSLIASTLLFVHPTLIREGNFPDIGAAGGLHEFLTDLHKDYGPIASFWFGTKFTVSIASPELFKEHRGPFDRPRK